MNQILLFLFLIGIFIYFTYNNNQENFTTMAENLETGANMASLYNTSNFTATNLNVTGTLTVNGVPITGSNSTLNIPNINTGVIGANSASVNGAINAASLTTSGNLTSSGLITGAIRASGDITTPGLNTDTITAPSGTLGVNGVITGSSAINCGGDFTTNGSAEVHGILYYYDGTSERRHFTSKCCTST